MAQSSPKMRQNALFRASNLKIFPGKVPYPPMVGGMPPSHTLPPTCQRRVEGAEAPYYITLTATPFRSPSTAKFGENPDTYGIKSANLKNKLLFKSFAAFRAT